MKRLTGNKMAIISAVVFAIIIFATGPIMPVLDSSGYADVAKNLYTGRGFETNFETDLVTAPGVPYSLAAFMLVFGTDNLIYMKAFLAFFAFLAALFSFLLFRELSGKEWAALLSTIVLITVPEFVFIGLSILADIPTIALMSACAWVFVRALRKGDIRLWAMSGALLGVSVLFRYTAVLLGIVLVLYSLKKLMKGKGRVTWKHIMAFMGIAIIVFSPWAFRELSYGYFPGQQQSSAIAQDIYGVISLEIKSMNRGVGPRQITMDAEFDVPIQLINAVRITGSVLKYSPVITVVFVYMLLLYYGGRRKHNELLMLIWFFVFLVFHLLAFPDFSVRYMFAFLVPMCYFLGMFAAENWDKKKMLIISIVVLQLLSASYVFASDLPVRGESTMVDYLAGSWIAQNTPVDEPIHEIGSGGYTMAFYADRKVINLGDPVSIEDIKKIKSMSPETIVICNIMKRSFDEDLLISELGYDKCYEASDNTTQRFVRVYRQSC